MHGRGVRLVGEAGFYLRPLCEGGPGSPSGGSDTFPLASGGTPTTSGGGTPSAGRFPTEPSPKPSQSPAGYLELGPRPSGQRILDLKGAEGLLRDLVAKDGPEEGLHGLDERGSRGGSGDPRIVQQGRLRFLAPRSAIVTVGIGHRVHQLCHILFGPDGSIYVHPCFFKSRAGIVSRVELDSAVTYPATVNLMEYGRATSHLVKFSHHTSGEALFSLTKRVRTAIRRVSWPLDGPIGTVFQLNAYGVDGFEEVGPHRKNDRSYLHFIVPGPQPSAAIVIGRWRRKRDLEATMVGRGEAGPVADLQDPDTGALSKAFFVGQPRRSPLQDHLLVVQCFPSQMADSAGPSSMLLFGGYDHQQVIAPGLPAPDTGFLACMYPVDSPEELARTIGSIDIIGHGRVA